MKYKAFISYSHRQDSKLAPSLEYGLEKFARPIFKRRAINIFRDANDLSASPNLWGKIEEGLGNSDFFIFLASQAAAQSRWCKKEVEFWKTRKTMENFLVVLTDGELVWDEGKNDFDWTRTTALPDNLSGAFINEPLYVDFRGEHKSEDLTLEHPEFKSKLVLLAATLHGRSVGDMVGEAAIQHKRTIRMRNGAISLLSVLLIATGLSAFIAVKQKNIAQAQTTKALHSSYISNSRSEFVRDPTKALRLAEHAYFYAKDNNLTTRESADQLIKVFYSGQGFYQQPGMDIPVALDTIIKTEHQGISLISKFDYDNKFRRRSFDRQDYHYGSTNFYEIIGDRIVHTYEFDFKKDMAKFSNDGKYILAYDGNTSLQVVDVFRRRTNTSIMTLYSNVHSPVIEMGYLSSGIPFALVAGGDLNVPKLDFMKAPREKNAEIQLEGFSGLSATIIDAAITKDGNYSILGAVNGMAALIDNNAHWEDRNWNADKFKVKYIFKNSKQTNIRKVRFFDNDKFVLTESLDTAVDSIGNLVNGSSFFVWKTLTMPYIQIPEKTYFSDWEIIENGYICEIAEDGPASYSGQMILKNKKGTEIAKFPEASSVDVYKASANGQYYSDQRGVFNNSDEELISLDLNVRRYRKISSAFSEDSRFYIVSYNSRLKRIFALDPEFILDRMNNPALFGTIASLNDIDNDRFLITGNEIERNYQYQNQDSITIKKPIVTAKILVDGLRLRNRPDLKGKTIANLTLGEVTVYLLESSVFSSKVNIDGKDITRRWFKVETTSGLVGWIHGCCLELIWEN